MKSRFIESVAGMLSRLSFVVIVACHVAIGAEETIEEMLDRLPVVSKRTQKDAMLNRRVVSLLSLHHYNAGQVDEKRSSQWFNEYFKSLDYTKNLFLASDIEDFRSYESILGNDGNYKARLDFAFNVYERFLQRLREFAIFSVKCVDGEHDFTQKEYLDTNYKEMTWCSTRQELEDLWRRRVKNALLVEELAQEKAAKEAAEKPEGKAEEKKVEEEGVKAAVVLSPKERMKRSYARNYKRRAEVDSIEVMEIFLNALARTYDPHSAYMAPETKENFDIDMSLSLQGIGATLTTKDSYVTIVSVVPGGPAERDGRLKEGDRIVAVAQDGEEPVDVVDMSLNRVVRQIRGKKGTKVHLTILAEGSNTPQLITIVRDEVKLTESEAQSEVRTLPMGDGKTARVLVLYLPKFYADFAARNKGDKNYKSSSRDVRELLEKGVGEGGIDGVILDFRGNGGGSLEDAVKLAGLFFEEGPVVQIRNQIGKISRLEDPDKTVQYEGPLMVMVDKFSASASEIVAAALQDTGRALVVGDKMTHGKGTVQNVLDLDRQFRNSSRIVNLADMGGNGSLKLTVAKFYRVNGESTQVKGVSPDIVFPAYTDYMETEEGALPFALPWDKIEPDKYPEFNQVRPAIPALRKASADRLEKASNFKEYVENIEFFGNLRKRKQLPLDKVERQGFISDEETATKMLQKFQAQRKNARKRGTSEKIEEIKDAYDLILDETLQIMGDLIQVYANK
ncbi:MAG: carboxy terminal-processing peptidase [Lentisphaerae bacterium]|jgi:carboxyl-terminal processing protease|nr:carboxy terminal-processing peptidase [Lentisphaerota bacterium]